MTKDELEALWKDPASWKGGVLYSRREDPRTIVPRRYRWGGWTMNFGHPTWALHLLGIIAATATPLLLVIYLGGTQLTVLMTMFAVITGVILYANWEATRDR